MPNKRLIVACDGTWANSDSGFQRNWLPGHTSEVKLTVPSNVTRITRAIPPKAADGVTPQITYYQAGLGSENNLYSYIAGGFLGQGISENIREAYAFLCNNYEPGDDIFLIGFSRGAFTARSISALVSEVGLLTAQGLDSFYPIFKDWENQANDYYVPDHGSIDWPVDRPSFSSPEYLRDLQKLDLTRLDIPIKAVAVWDTVGTLGIPELDIVGFKLFSNERREYSFVNTEVASQVENAFHALALDEERKPFKPTIWEWPSARSKTRLKVLRQCWFPGVHSNIGGGYADTSMSDVPLAWMMTQLESMISFEPQFLKMVQRKNVQYYKMHDMPVRSWAMGQIRKSDGGALNAITGRKVRTPGTYQGVNAQTGNETGRLLTNTCEFIHPSVFYRIQQQGPGLANSDDDPGQGLYDPAALKGWTFVEPGANLPPEIHLEARAQDWRDHAKWVTKSDGEIDVFIVEERIQGSTPEMVLLDEWPGVSAKVVQ